MAGSAIMRKLEKEGYNNIITANSKELDLRNQQQTQDFFEKNKPEYVFLAAAKVGGIYANNVFRAEFLYDNLMIEANCIHAAYSHNVKKLLFLGSSCIYPKLAPQPLKESYLLQGELEPTNEPYAIAKISGIKLCDAYRSQYDCNFTSCMPTNLYGPNDNYHPENSHVLPALLRKFILAKRSNLDKVEIWGSGNPLREFLHVDDMADACYFLMENFNEPGFVNVGSGVELSIKDLALMIADVVGFRGELSFNSSKPDGTPRKLMDVSKLKQMGWASSISLREGIEATYKLVADFDFKA